jgi:acetyl esterase/lipase
MLSTAHSDNVELVVWDRTQRRLLPLTNRGLWLKANIDDQADPHALNNPGVTHTPFAWLDDTTILCVLLPQQFTDRRFASAYATVRDLAVAWDRAAKGSRSTASIFDFDGHGSSAYPATPSLAVVSIDVRSGRTTELAALPFRYTEDQDWLVLSPRHTQALILSERGFVLPAGRPSAIDSTDLIGDVQVRVFALQTPHAALTVPLKAARPPRSILTGRFAMWAPSSDRFVVVGPSDERGVQHLYGCPVTGDVCRDLSQGGLNVQSIAEVRGACVVVRATEAAVITMATSRSAMAPDASTWWCVAQESPRDNGRLRRCWPIWTIKSAPELVRSLGTDLIFLANGDLWIVSDPNSPRPRKLLLPLRVGSVLGQTVAEASRGDGTALVSVNQGGSRQRAWYRLVWQSYSAQLTEIPAPAAASLLAFNPAASNLAVFRVDGQITEQSIVTSQNGAMAIDSVVTINSNARYLRRSRVVKLRYATPNRDSLAGLLTLPDAYESGARYPMIVRIYPGDSWDLGRDDTLPSRVDLLAAHGFAVLDPSLPTPDSSLDPSVGWLDAVNSAINRAVELGYADSNRLALWGHSYGGYAVYSILSQTHRFRTAVAMSAPSELAAWYGAYDVIARSDSFPVPLPSGQYLLEGGQFHLETQPWTNPDRYVRNSPLLHFGTIDTPLMVVHGDLDFIPIDQSENVVTALRRRGVPVRFARFWGEGHTIESTPNVRALWASTFDWLDHWLRGRVAIHD